MYVPSSSWSTCSCVIGGFWVKPPGGGSSELRPMTVEIGPVALGTGLSGSSFVSEVGSGTSAPLSA